MKLTLQLIEAYLRRLAEDERGAATIGKYRRDLLRFYEFLPEDKTLDKSAVLGWKENLVARRGGITVPTPRLTLIRGGESRRLFNCYNIRRLRGGGANDEARNEAL